MNKDHTKSADPAGVNRLCGTVPITADFLYIFCLRKEAPIVFLTASVCWKAKGQQTTGTKTNTKAQAKQSKQRQRNESTKRNDQTTQEEAKQGQESNVIANAMQRRRTNRRKPLWGAPKAI